MGKVKHHTQAMNSESQQQGRGGPVYGTDCRMCNYCVRLVGLNCGYVLGAESTRLLGLAPLKPLDLKLT